MNEIASTYIEDIFYNEADIKLEDLIHNRFKTVDDFNNFGVRKFLLNYIRCYDTNLNIDFVTGYLSVNKYNTIEEVESRKALFKTLPVITSNEVKQDAFKEEKIETVNPVEENIEVVKPVKKKTTSRKKK